MANLWSDRIYELYFRSFESPKVQTEFGFKMTHKRMFFRSQAIDVFIITSLEPTGVLAKVGVQPNTVALGAFPKNDIAFCKELLRSHDRNVEIHLINANEYEQLLRKGESYMVEWGYKVIIPRQNQIDKTPNKSTMKF
jgi:hypothetical protein